MGDKFKNKGVPRYQRGNVVNYGFFMGLDEVTYDIYAHTEGNSEGVLYKNVKEDSIKKVISYTRFSDDEEL